MTLRYRSAHSRPKVFLPALVVAALAATTAQSQPVALADYGLSTYGMPGLIDMPTATVMADGTLALTLSAMRPAHRATLAFQPLPRVTVSFRYGGARDLMWRQRHGSPFLYDRSFDLHVLLFREGRYMPAVAVGLRDFIGTGLYSSEYVVVSRTLSPRVRASMGMGWGRLASHGGFANPLGALHPGFRTRPRGTSGLGGMLEFRRFFRGQAALFGGVEFQATDRLTLVAEYSSDAYVREQPFVPHRVPVNLSLRYRHSPGTTLSAYVLHGSTVGVAAAFALNPAQPAAGPVRIAAPVPIGQRAAPPAAGYDTSWTAGIAEAGAEITRTLSEPLAEEGIRLDRVELEARRVVLQITNQRHETLPRAIGRTARILSRTMPGSVEEFVIIPNHGSTLGAAVVLRRSDLERAEADPDGSDRLLASARFADPVGMPGVGRAWQTRPESLQPFEWAIGPYVDTSLFDPHSPVRADIGLQAILRLNLAQNLSINATISQRLAGNIDGGSLGPDTVTGTRFTPRVRTISLLYSTNRPTVERLTADYTVRPMENVYGRLTVGWLERMYAGASAELLWSPADSRLALGVEVNSVAQRDHRTVLGLNPLRITTGHASAYYSFGRGFRGQLDVGRYLAGDVGATLTLARTFANGLTVGAYATLTDMPTAVFGEGSFDKGIFVNIPMAVLLGQPSIGAAAINLQPINRDGGARLRVPGRLYPTIQESRAQALRQGWGAILQ